MGYYYTTSPENAVPPNSCAMPKTHTPASPVKERGYRYYSPEMGRWLSRDPIGDEAFVAYLRGNKSYWTKMALAPSYAFVGNCSPNSVDIAGLSPTPFFPPPPPPAPPIDCSGYSSLGGTSCTICFGFGMKSDGYPAKAKKVCDGFASMYTGEPNQAAAACVAQCLISNEVGCQTLTSCSDRNCCRLGAHVACYAKCGFFPTKGLPPGGLAVGVVDVAASCASKGAF